MQLREQIALNSGVAQSCALVGSSDIMWVSCWTAFYAQALRLINRLRRKTLSKHRRGKGTVSFVAYCIKKCFWVLKAAWEVVKIHSEKYHQLQEWENGQQWHICSRRTENWYGPLNNHSFFAKHSKLNLTCHLNLMRFLFISGWAYV